MGRMLKRALIWGSLLSKRLYKKPSFIALLLLIPLIVCGYNLAAHEDSGMITIVVGCEDPSDVFSSALRKELSDSSNIIRFIGNDDLEKCRRMVSDGVVDAAWIIDDDIELHISDYVAGQYTGHGFVEVIVREQTVPLILANEKLSASLFARCARTCYLQYFRINAPEMDTLSDDEILAFFDGVTFDDDLFVFSYVDHHAVPKLNYLTMPVRGMLAVLVFVSGLAAAMYYASDDQEGLFFWVRTDHKQHVQFGYLFVCVGNIALFVLLALVFSSNCSAFLIELIAIALYVVCCCVFCQLLQLVFNTGRVMAVLFPILAILSLVACPVFIALPSLKWVSLALPPTYFINSIYNTSYLFYMLVYIALLKVIHDLINRFVVKK